MRRLALAIPKTAAEAIEEEAREAAERHDEMDGIAKLHFQIGWISQRCATAERERDYWKRLALGYAAAGSVRIEPRES